MPINGFAQDFLDGSFTFSKKKAAYLTLTDGKEITGFLDDIDRKKGLIKKIVLKDSTGKKMEFLPEQLQYMYLAPTGWDKFTRSMEKVNDFSEWDRDQTINKAYIKDGYVRFEKAEVIIKKDTLNLLMQLVNPGYASKIRVYFDPNAAETSSMAIGGMTVSGGDAKSYYVKRMGDTAYKLEKEL
ncbi:MAG: hypothetical protein IPN29_10030 [Saprospiraceae bacterium]|nr:hypothetical protein [Saprospiraceae bacterium]